MFTRAIVRVPSQSLIRGITTADLGLPDYDKAMHQHAAYVAVLEACGLDVTMLPAVERYPDATFVEDVALLTPRCAIVTRPGAETRLAETTLIEPVLSQFYADIEHIKAPGTVEAGDIMMVGLHFYIGLSARTNALGAEQMIAILERYNMTGSVVPLTDVLHLKTGLSYLENNHLLVGGEFKTCDTFEAFSKIFIDDDEAYAANCVWINGTVLVPKGFPKARAALISAGFNCIELDMSEFQKIDGGLSCLSLRF